MKKAYNHLFITAAALGNKYASYDAADMKDYVKNTLQMAVANASTAKLGIMPFISMLKEDDAALNINVTRNGDQITVSPPAVDKPELAAKYATLPQQIKAYLERNLEVFPTRKNDQSIEYHNLTVTLEYPASPRPQIASL